jgi:hypothetical protein
VRCIEPGTYTITGNFKPYEVRIQASSEVAQDETTEQVFSRKDRKAYRAEVLGQRTETKRGNAKRKASAMGKEGGPKAKTRRTA